MIGKRDTATVKRLYQLLKNSKIDEFCTDQWRAFAHIFKKEYYWVGKDLTRHVKRVNNGLGVRNRHCVRKTTRFPKKGEDQASAIKIMFQQ